MADKYGLGKPAQQESNSSSSELLAMNDVQVTAFWSKVDIQKDKKKCWEWRGARKPKGYGNVRVNKRYMQAHRVAFELAHGKIPDGFMICHICDNPSCCNPSHLMLGNAKSNAADMLIKGRQRDKTTAARGSVNGMSKITEADVLKIRDLYSRKSNNQYELAEMFGVSQPCIGSIVRNETWRHV